MPLFLPANLTDHLVLPILSCTQRPFAILLFLSVLVIEIAYTLLSCPHVLGSGLGPEPISAHWARQGLRLPLGRTSGRYYGLFLSFHCIY